MSEITDFLTYDCNIVSKTSSWEDSYWTPVKSTITKKVKCFISSPRAWVDYDETSIKIDAILFLEPNVEIKWWDEVNSISKNWTIIDSKMYKVLSIEPAPDDEWIHHLEVNLLILW